MKTKNDKGLHSNDMQNKNKKSNGKFMSFFRELVKTVLKINFAQLARRAGVSQQYISYWMRVDDARLSNIINLLAKIGINLSCKYDVLPIAPTIINGYNYRLVIHDLGHVGYNTGLDCGIIQKAKTSDSRLHFLAQYLSDRGLDIATLSRQTGISYTNLYAWFAKDDIKVSKIYQIAESQGARVVWTISAITGDDVK